MYKPTASISSYVGCESAEEFDQAWKALSEGGTVVSAPAKTPWSEKYGWITDAFNVSWQLGVNLRTDIWVTITLYLMFTGGQYGRADDSIQHYDNVFKRQSPESVVPYGPVDALERAAYVRHAELALL